jgi:2-dehydro-3-deoxyphosphogluconate aldolase / (4S)-4-hydroxy-2-oxoglutarate aldolase
VPARSSTPRPPTSASTRARRSSSAPASTLTPTEVITAWNHGADLVKIFPVSAMGGASYLRALRGPLPEVKLLPTGGITAANAAEYLKAGASAIGVGSELVDTKALAEGRDAVVTERARELCAAVQAARASRPG